MTMLNIVTSAISWPRQPLPNPSNIYMENVVLYLHKETLPSTALAVERDCRLQEQDIILERSTNGRLINCGKHHIQPSSASPSTHIKLLEPFSTGLRNLRYAQVWKVECGDEICVARIYDPLYVGEDDMGVEDVFLKIAKLLVAEASAYTRLEVLQGNLIPRFKGCFLTMMDTVDADILKDSYASDPNIPQHPDIPLSRGVYVLLLAYIPGKNISGMPTICDAHKVAVVRSICVAWHELDVRGILHDDFEGRNVVLKDLPLSTDPFCEVVGCAKRQQFSTTPPLKFDPERIFPIAIIDLENTLIDETEDGRLGRPLITQWEEAKENFGSTFPAWFS